MTLYKEIELQKKERIVDSLATENQMLQEPKTPTKEQIEKIYDEVFFKPNNTAEPYRLGFLPSIEKIILLWEKIRNS